MSLKKMLIPAALIAVIALLAPRANAQTMGEYATTTAGVGTGSGSMGTNFAVPPSIGPSDLGGGSRTWGASALGSSWSERAGAASGSGLEADFASRAGSMTSGSGAESRWPGAGISGGQGNSAGASRFDTGSDRFSSGDRFTGRADFSSASRWPTSSFSDHMGVDTTFNSINGN
jgi:hypothetical protein